MSAQAFSVRQPVTIRKASPEDAAACGRICYEAFTRINRDHNFPPDFPSPDVTVGLLSMLFSHPGFYCVVAEAEGRVAGSNCLDERTPIASLGPITVDPSVQNRGVGRALMLAVLDRARERGFPGVRLVQAAFHCRSLSLYSSLGFVAREPLSVMQGPAMGKRFDGYSVREARLSDLPACNAVCHRVHGHDRGGDVADAIAQGTARVVERGGRITGYASGLSFFSHAVAETLPDLQALIASAETFGGPGILVPSRNAHLLRWCLENGLRIVEPMTLMTLGLYNEPAGPYLPAVLY